MFTRSTKPLDPNTLAPQPSATLTPPPMPSYATSLYSGASAPAPSAPVPVVQVPPAAAPATALGKKSATSIVTADLKIKGDLESEGDIQLEGQVFGTVSAPSLTISESGAVHGEIFVDTLRVYGKIVGTSRAKVVDLAKSSHVVGDIFHQQLTIETGAYIDGHCKRVDNAEVKPAPKEAVREVRAPEPRAEAPARSEPPPRTTLRARARAEAASESKSEGGDRIAAMLGKIGRAHV